MDERDGTAPRGRRKQERWDRAGSVECLSAFKEASPKLSQREFARRRGVPRSTLQHWLTRKEGLDSDPRLGDFFESPLGLAVVHRVVAAAHVVFGQMGSCGVRLMRLFLQLSRLDRTVACSVGSQHAVARSIEELIVEFGSEERARLAPAMPKRRISVCEDEKFFPELCLVSMEPVSGFLLLECYSERRDSESWNDKMQKATADLNVDVQEVVSDEAKALLAHAHEAFGARHGPDLFHIQHEVVKATALGLSSRTRQAAQRLEEVRGEVQKHLQQRDEYWSVPHGPGRPPPFEGRIVSARAVEEQQAFALQAAQERQALAQETVRAIGQSYHPVRLEDGLVRSPEQLEAELTEHFDRIEGIATAAALSQASFERIAKARRLIDSMVAALSFFFVRLRLALEELSLGAELELLVRESLVPGLYLRLAASKAPGAERRAALLQTAKHLLERARAADGPLAALPDPERRRVEEVAQHCAELFQRSSSCVEGRNGQLALRHHSLHRLSERKLSVLTTLHNYFLRRPDRTTAAERFFGSKPLDLFEWVLDRLEIPARPARARSRPLRLAS